MSVLSLARSQCGVIALRMRAPFAQTAKGSTAKCYLALFAALAKGFTFAPLPGEMLTLRCSLLCYSL